MLDFEQVKKTQTQRNVDVGKEKSSVLSPSDTSQSSSSFFFPLRLPLLPYICLLLESACFGIPTKLPQLHSNRFWLPSFGGLFHTEKDWYTFFFYFEYGLIYFVRSPYKTVKKDLSFCKMILFI